MSAEEPDCPITVIIPFYDETAFLPAAVESVIAQGIDGLEIIVVNDNPEVFGEAAFEGLQATVIHHEQNRGLSAARNSGIAAARGRHIAFLDADDYYLSGGLKAQWEYAVETGADMTHAQTLMTAVGSTKTVILPRDQRLFRKSGVRGGLNKSERCQFIVSSWSSIYSADFLARHALRFDEEQRKFEDRLFVLDAVCHAETIAYLGRPTRVWRKRAGSISTSSTDFDEHHLQLGLIEKCTTLVADRSGHHGLPERVYQRELFQAISRIVWDTRLLEMLAKGGAEYDPLRERVLKLVRSEKLKPRTLSDTLVMRISRIGEQTARGCIEEGDFLHIVRYLREGKFDKAYSVVAQEPSPVRKTLPYLILHLGLHKTGTTSIQNWCLAHRDQLLARGVLFPNAGLPDDFRPIREGGFPGHQELMKPNADAWDNLRQEIAESGCETVIISCENMLMPLRPDRDKQIAAICGRLREFASVRIVVGVRRPDVWLDRFYREIVSNGHGAGARSVDEFLCEYEKQLLDLPALLAPFAALGEVELIDYAEGPVAGFARMFKMAEGVTDPSYLSPDPNAIAGARLINTSLTDKQRRISALREYFQLIEPEATGQSLLTHRQRREAIELFRLKSGDWAAERGYMPDYDAMIAEIEGEQASPPRDLPQPQLELALRCIQRAEINHPTKRPRPKSAPPSVTFMLQPWVWRAIQWLRGR